MYGDTVKRQYQFTKSADFNEATLEVLNIRKTLLFNSYEKFMGELLMVVEQSENHENLQQTKQEAVNLEEVFITALATFEEKIAAMSVEVENVNIERLVGQVNVNDENESEPITLTKFDGDYIQFDEWIQEFDNKVHNQVIMSDNEKYGFLMGALGEKLTVQFNGYTNDQYLQLYQILTKKYKCAYQLMTALTDKLDEIPIMMVEEEEAINYCVQTTRYVLQRLKEVDLAMLRGDFFIMHKLLKKLPTQIVTAFEARFTADEIPMLWELLIFLESIVEKDKSDLGAAANVNTTGEEIPKYEETGAIKEGELWAEVMEKHDEVMAEVPDEETVEERQIEHLNLTQNPADLIETGQVSSNPNVFSNPLRQETEKENRSSVMSNVKLCFHCNRAHRIYNCTEFREMTVADRIKRIEILQVCANCFMPGHKSGDVRCKSDQCHRCGQLHNSMICLRRPFRLEFGNTSELMNEIDKRKV